jgi:hypothetical protein
MRTTRSASVNLKSDTGPTPAVTKINTTQSRNQILIADPVEYNAPLSPQPSATTNQPPKKRGRKPKAATSDADKEPLPKKAKSSMVKAPPQNRDALPARGVRNDRPAIKANVIPSTRRTSKQVAADREAARKVAQEEAERGKAAMRLLAEMQVDEEMFDEDMEIDNPHHLAVVGAPGRVRSRVESEGESFESISSSPDSDSDEDKPVKVNVSSTIHPTDKFFYSLKLPNSC